MPIRDPGQLRHRVTIERDTGTTVNAANEHVPSWTAFATRWARVMYLSGREYWQSQQVQATVTATVELRHLDGVTPAMRVKWGSKYLYIEAVQPDETQTWLTLMCAEVA